MDKTFEPKNFEHLIYDRWEKSGYFQPSGSGKPFCIVVPPPNVTGSLHMGHGFQLSLMDAMIRYHRMLGFNTHWQMGTDHAGIATQLVVEKQLADKGIMRADLGRQEFTKKIWEWKEISKNRICQQMRRMGVSADWQRERFTLDAGLSAAVQKVFIELYNEGLIYRGQFLVNWDPVLKTAVSDLEVNSEEQDGKLWHIKYPIQDTNEALVVATTRPETLFGDTAVAVHPDDERYQKFIGKMIKLPLTDRLIPIIADTSVEREFGTGCVKITPAHDFNDYATGERHNLPRINILTLDAKLNENVPEDYRGLDRFVAREKVVNDLNNAGLLIKIEPHRNKVPKGDRTGTILEPYLTNQWFVRAKPLAEQAIHALKSGEFKFVPENWDKTYLNWLENIEDWCISRQLWWGHRIPAWYDNNGNIYVGESENEIRSQNNIAPEIILTQEEDVLDTWFSSALWPFSSLGWPEQTADLQNFYPTNVLVTGFDIIFFWVARMVMMGKKFTNKAPFNTVYITGLIRDSKGQKMSKSKGNILDPLDLIDGVSLEELITKRTSNLLLPSIAKDIEKATRDEFPNGISAFGTDALRFTFCALASTSRDINFDIGRLDGYRNFCNKIWNAARFVMMSLEKISETPKNDGFSLADLWIKTKLQQLITSVEDGFKTYRFDLIAQAIYEFTWHEFCDWYLEFCKPTLNMYAGTSQTLVEVLEKLLRIMHPLMPFITEEIWQQIAPLAKIDSPSIMTQNYPEFNHDEVSSSALNKIEWLKQVILAIRNIRGEINVAPNKTISIIFNKGEPGDKELIQETELYLKFLARIDNIKWLNEGEVKPESTYALVGNLEIMIPLAGLVDLSAEKARLEKEIAKLEKDKQVLEQKLGNANFVDKAPPEVVANEKLRLENTKIALEKLKDSLLKLGYTKLHK